WKMEFWNHRLQFNGAKYWEEWDNVQVAFFDPGLVGNIFYNTNGQNFKIDGIEMSLAARLFTGLTIQAAGNWNNSRQTNSPALTVNNPASVNFGKPLTEQCDSAGQNCTPVTNPFGPIGSPAANAPPLQLSAHARYQWNMGAYFPYVQFGWTHSGHSFTQA